MARPTVDRFTEHAYALLPDYIRNADVVQDWALLKFISGCTDQAEVVRGIMDVTDYLTSPSGTVEVASPALCPPQFLSWLAGLLGLNANAYPSTTSRAVIQNVAVTGRRGSQAAMTARIQAYLTGAQRVLIQTNYLGSIWKMLVQTYTAETPDPTSAGIAAQKEAPAGVVVTFSVLTGITYTQLGAKYSTYSIMQATNQTYDQLAALQS